MKVLLKRLRPEAKIPEYKSDGAACMDIYAALVEDSYGNDWCYLRPGETKIIQTGLTVEVPQGYELIIRSRSGLASNGIHLANGVGTIDSDYRGEVGVILTNVSGDIIKIKTGDRIAQCKVEKVIGFYFEEVPELSETKRGSGGYGHTGD